VNVTYENTAKALREAHWQGRMEQIRDGIYVDGAHNPEGVRSLTQSVPFIAKEKPAVLLFSAVSDKNVDEMARILSESGVFVKVYITQLEGSRKLDAATIREAFIRNKFTCCDVCDDYDEAFMKAVRAARRLDGVLFVSGSLYLVGDITRLCGGLN
jgi:dihydrofolate synthase/folylpolyglutamate synthase